MKFKNLIAITLATAMGCIGTAHANYEHLYAQIDEYNKTPSQIAKQYHAVYRAAILHHWKQPKGAQGAYVRVRMSIKPDGNVRNARIDTLTDELRLSMQNAIYAAQPYIVPTAPSAARLTMKVDTVFFVK